jgi:hypothetical protein
MATLRYRLSLDGFLDDGDTPFTAAVDRIEITLLPVIRGADARPHFPPGNITFADVRPAPDGSVLLVYIVNR